MKTGIVKIGNWAFFGKNTIGLTIYPFIFIKKSWADNVDKYNLEKTINHERIHIIQQIELLVLPFYIFYIFEFIYRFLLSQNFNDAYNRISFEKEAYQNESNQEYLKKRKIWGFIKYF